MGVENLPLLPSGKQAVPHSRRWPSRGQCIFLCLWFLFCVWDLNSRFGWFQDWWVGSEGSRIILEKACPQSEPLTPSTHSLLVHRLLEVYSTDDFRLKTAKRLSGAVQIPTESYDDLLPVGEDSRWEVFGQLHPYLLATFPNIHSTLKLVKVNTYGLVYDWAGSDPTLQPILLTGHQDVVPVGENAESRWVHPPYSGHFDGDYVWGRGSMDNKNGVVSILSTVESLLENGFKPRRTIVLAFGFDEESKGEEGAGRIAQYLEKQYGKNGFAFLLDEGGTYSEKQGVLIANPGIMEKGSFNTRIEVTAPSGHSMNPPKHTSIGYLSAILTRLEAHPPTPRLFRSSSVYLGLQCEAAYAPDAPKWFTKLVARSLTSDKALKNLEKEVFEREGGDYTKSMLVTTQAADIINGGVKMNVLPENAVAIVNHRIATDSSVDALTKHLTSLFLPLAKKYDLAYNAFGRNITILPNSPRRFTISDAYGTGLEPAPISPTDSAAYKLLSGSIRATHRNGRYEDRDIDLIVAPGMPGGNTDTRFYWNLTRNIFRYSHSSPVDGYNGYHNINEAYRVDGIVEQIRFMTYLILNSDESSDL